jgi:excisionase family DNA binding protein
VYNRFGVNVMATDNDWLTVQEAADLSGYNAEYLRRLIRNNKIAYRKISFIYQVSRASLFEYLSRAENTSDKRYTPKRKE